MVIIVSQVDPLSFHEISSILEPLDSGLNHKTGYCVGISRCPMDPQKVVGQIRVFLFFKARKCFVMRNCCCKYKHLDISRLLSYADIRTIELCGIFHRVTQLLRISSYSSFVSFWNVPEHFVNVYKVSVLQQQQLLLSRVTDCLESSTVRESYNGRLLIQETLEETVSLAQW